MDSASPIAPREQALDAGFHQFMGQFMSRSSQNQDQDRAIFSHPDPDSERDQGEDGSSGMHYQYQLDRFQSNDGLSQNHVQGSDWWKGENRGREGMDVHGEIIPQESLYPSVHPDSAPAYHHHHHHHHHGYPPEEMEYWQEYEYEYGGQEMSEDPHHLIHQAQHHLVQEQHFFPLQSHADPLSFQQQHQHQQQRYLQSHLSYHPNQIPFTPEPEPEPGHYHTASNHSSRTRNRGSNLKVEIHDDSTPTKIKAEKGKEKNCHDGYVRIHPWSQPVRIKRESQGRGDEDKSKSKVIRKVKPECKVNLEKSENLRRKVKSEPLGERSKKRKVSAKHGKGRRDDSDLEKSEDDDDDDDDSDSDTPPSFPETHSLIVRIRPFNSIASSIGGGTKSKSFLSSSSIKKPGKASDNFKTLKNGIMIFREAEWRIKSDRFIQLQYEIDQARNSNTPSLTFSDSDPIDQSSKPNHPTSSVTCAVSPCPSDATANAAPNILHRSKSLASLSPKSRKGLILYQKRKAEIERQFEFLPTAFDNRSHRNFLASRLGQDDDDSEGANLKGSNGSVSKSKRGKGIDLEMLWANWVKRELNWRKESRTKNPKGDSFKEVGEKKAFEIQRPSISSRVRSPFLQRNLKRGVELREREIKSFNKR